MKTISTKTKDPVFELSITTPDGRFVARYSSKGLCSLDFPSETRRPNGEPPLTQAPPEVLLWHEVTKRALNDTLMGKHPENLPPLDLSSGTDFQQRVWQALRKISFGRSLSYGQVAEAIGKPKAVRAVGGACGANPIPVLVPCHRVLAANSRLGGFSSGLNWKRVLLAREGIKLG